MKKENYIGAVFDVVRAIPKGRVTNYGTIANFLLLGSARMVGWALNQCVPGDGVPAHRVVNSKGELSGRNSFPTPTTMQERLEKEGVKVENDRVVDFKKLLWHPEEEV
ncbi:MAG TPA: MGMT family protein [Bacteroidetes bacterium]|nr:MGMT family protein [Bacteroidota bacterium]